MDEDSVVVKCIAPLRKSKRADDPSAPPRSTRKGGLNRFVTTLSDKLAGHDPEKGPVVKVSASSHSSDDASKLAVALAALEEERAKTREVQHQLNLAMDLNTELKVSAGAIAEEIAADEQRRLSRLKMQLQIERRKRDRADSELAAARIDVSRLKSALERRSAEKRQLEAELLEAAKDILLKQKLESTLQETLRSGSEVQRAAEQSAMEVANLRIKLRASETGRQQLEAELTALRAETTKWEDVLDTLQDQLDDALLNSLGPEMMDSAMEPEMAVTQKEASCLAQACNAGALGFAEGIAEWIDSKTDGITECSDDFKPATEGGVLHTPHLVLA